MTNVVTYQHKCDVVSFRSPLFGTDSMIGFRDKILELFIGRFRKLFVVFDATLGDLDWGQPRITGHFNPGVDTTRILKSSGGDNIPAFEFQVFASASQPKAMIL